MRPFIATAAIAALLTVGPPAAAATAQFLTKAIEGDNSETTLGALAAQRGASAGVRQFGRTLVRDHQRARAAATPVAMRHHLRHIPRSMTAEAANERRILYRLHGRAFDREFARYMVNDHEKDISDFRKEASSSDPRDVRMLARQTLPTLQKHLGMAQALTTAR